jgi:hypothetical protein
MHFEGFITDSLGPDIPSCCTAVALVLPGHIRLGMNCQLHLACQCELRYSLGTTYFVL